MVCAFALPVSVARAWTWPVDGPVLRPFAFDYSSPYAGGQHRGVDLGAPAGTPVLAPAEGVVSFAGTVPSGGKTISIQTPFGYTATLLHLGSIGVTRGAVVGEGSVIGAVAAPADSPPFVYFGVRKTSDPQGYVDPLSLLPPRPALPAPAPSPPVEAPAQPETPAEPVVDSVAPAEAASAGSAASSAPAGVATPKAAGAVAPASHEPAPVTVPETGPVVRAVAPALEPQKSARALSLQAPRESAGAQGSTRTPHVGRAESSRPTPATTSSEPRGSAGHETSAGSPTLASNVASTAADRLHIPLALGALMVTLALALAIRRRSVKKAARIMSIPKLDSSIGAAETEEDPGRARLAVRRREAASRPRGRLRRPGGHLRALPPLEGQRRPDGEWNGRTWDTGDGDRGSRRRLAA